VNESSDPSIADAVALKRRLSALGPEQRTLLVRRLGGDPSAALPSAQSPATISKARPLRLEESPPVAVYPASHGQQRMWFLHHYAPESPVYGVAAAFHLTGPLIVAWLESAFRNVIQRHDILRTTFAVEDGSLTQHVAAGIAFRLQQIDLQEVPPDTREAAAERLLDEETCRPFDLAGNLPFRAILIKLHPDQHLLLVVLHHIISDGWSRSILYRDLSAAYEALASGRPAPVRELPVQFADYSAWQAQGLDGGGLETQIDYWKLKLAGQPEPLDLPTDRARPAVGSFRGSLCSRRLDPGLTAALKTRAQEEGATLFMILLAAFNTLLHRYTGQEDLIVGVPIANRQRVEVEELIGYCANTLVMRTAVQRDLTFRELLRRVKETAVAAYEHQDVPFERLVEVLQVRRDASRTPLFQTIFNVRDFPTVDFGLSEMIVTPRFVTTHTAKFDFSMTMEPSAGGWTAVAEYNTDLFDEDRVERMLGHWHTLLESIAADPAQRISEIPILTAAERQQILMEWNQTGREYPRDKCIHQLFEEVAEQSPEAVAVVFEGNTLTYRQLNASASHLAHQLQGLGVSPGELVGLRLDRSFEMIIAVLGILKAGGAYWALEENLPEERFSMMLAEALPRVLLAGRNSVEVLSNLVSTVRGFTVRVAAIEDLLESPVEGGIPTAPVIRAGGAAYVSYTSGSTGQPKGVVVPHRGVVRLVKGCDYVSLTTDETFLHLSPLSFDASTFELWGALLNGGRVVLLAPGPPSLTEIGDTIRNHGVTTLWLSAGLFHLMVDERLDDLKSLRQLLAGGDVLSPEAVRKVRRKLPGCRIVNGYGPTENTTFTCCHTVADERDLIPSVPIGRPIANTRVYVLDGHRQPVPIGVPGELHAGGDGLAIGYLNQPQLTAEKFIPDPFSSLPGARLYRTGDRVRWRADGNLEFLGRNDFQLKARGFLVEPGEIETALRKTVGVLEAVVEVRQDGSAEKRLVAYVVADPSQCPDEAAIKKALQGRLPDYMIPARVEFLAALPLLPNGKVDRRALPRLLQPAAKTNSIQSPALGLLELELSRLWERLFQRESIGRDEDFFDLGGHSLLAMRLTADIEKWLGRRVPIALLFQARSIAALAGKLQDHARESFQSSLLPLQTDGSELPIFCVHGLGGDVYCFLDLAREMAPDRPVYGLQAIGLDGQQARHATVEEMAAHYAREIRSVQPEGPYHLLGYSLGGWIAYALAQELTRQGSKVALLALLDTRPTSDVPWALYGRVMAPYLASRLGFHFKQWLRGPKNGRLRYLKQRAKWLHVHTTRARAHLPIRSSSDREEMAVDYFDAVAARYRPAAYSGDVTLFAGTDAKHFPHAAFWKHFVSGCVRVHRVAGDHRSMLDPLHVADFAVLVKQAVSEAESAVGICPRVPKTD